ncbi:sialic acid-binding Ig-like lectin 14 [Monodelphis domestica]|uniref:sialic acid-binding Ig-like lectin 14 n=1 Tax=Monodelphis domestica TaxID=13616 RepID=UPI0024E23E2F|nr:sialic acid-binding Ig-like lectin 14 [Monodelphis domestica]
MDLLLLLLLLPLLWRRTISQNTEFRIHVKKTVRVQEGLCVSIPCSFNYPQQYRSEKKVHGYWKYVHYLEYLAATNDPQKQVHSWAKGRFHLTGDLQLDNCSFTITRAQKNDQGNYRFLMKKGELTYNFKDDTVSVQVEDLTQKPEVHVPEMLLSGDQATLTCTVPGACREGTAISYLWTGAALSSSRFESQELYFTPKPQDHDTSLTCKTTFLESGVSTETTVRLRVFYPPQKMNIRVSWANRAGPEFPGNASTLVVLEGESLTLVCGTRSYPPAALSWAHRGQILNSTQASDPGVLHLELSRLGTNASGEYNCQARNTVGQQNYSVRLCVQLLTQKPEVHIPEVLQSGRQVTLTCLVPGPCREGKHLTYLWNGTALSSQGSALWNTNSSKLLFTPRAQDHGTNITCQVIFPKARVSIERTVQLRVAYPPQNTTISVSGAIRRGQELLGNTSSLRVLEGESLTLVCATESNPPATLIWTHKNQVLQSSQASDPGVLYLELSKLGPKNRGKYTCQAQHPLGSQQHSMRLCVQTCACCPVPEEEDGSWPLILTLLRGVLMGAGFLLTYGLTWLYYSCQDRQSQNTMDKSVPMDVYSVPVF